MKEKEKLEAIRLREQGWSLNELKDHLGVAKSTVSMWVRGVPISKDGIDILNRRLQFDEDKAVELFSRGESYVNIAQIVGISKSSLMGWFNRNGYRRKRQLHTECQICKQKNTKSLSKYCPKCGTTLRRYCNKIRAVKYKGGKCKRCGLVLKMEEYAAYEFHHLRDKEFNIGQLINLKWERVKDEIDKCDLLCSNCHRITHCNSDINEIMKEAEILVNSF